MGEELLTTFAVPPPSPIPRPDSRALRAGEGPSQTIYRPTERRAAAVPGAEGALGGARGASLRVAARTAGQRLRRARRRRAPRPLHGGRGVERRAPLSGAASSGVAG